MAYYLVAYHYKCGSLMKLDLSLAKTQFRTWPYSLYLWICNAIKSYEKQNIPTMKELPHLEAVKETLVGIIREAR